MKDSDLTRFIHPEDPRKLNGGLRMRLALLQLVQEVAPDSDDAVVAVDGELDYSAVRFRDPPRRHRWPGFPRGFEARQRLALIVANVFPEATRGAAVFFRRGETIGFLELPLPRPLRPPA